MKTLLEIVAAWTALDAVLIAAWHHAHVRSRRLGTEAIAAPVATQRVVTLAPDAYVRDTSPTLVRAGRG